MWPESKGKGGKDGSSKSKDGGGDGAKPSATGGKSGGKGRNTKTKMKALAADTAAHDAAQASAQLEQDIIKAAQSMDSGQFPGPGQGQSEETKTLIETNRVPDSMVHNPSLQPGQQQPRAQTMPAYNAQAAQPPQAPAQDSAPAANLVRLPAQTSDNIDEKISSLWKNKVLGAYRANPRASQHILPAMPNNRGALEITEKARADAQHAAMVTLVDKMFDRFQNLAFEFNSVATPELELTWIRPVISRENIASWHQAAQVVAVFAGRISTRYWTMVVRGTPDCVLAYVIPADKLLTFSNQPANFQPVIELIPMADGLTVRWSLMGRLVNAEDLHNVYRALLDNMIRVAQDDAPCDRFIDLAAYGVYLQGEQAPSQQPDQTPSQAMGQSIDYSAKYQQLFGRPPSAPNLGTGTGTANQAVSSMSGSGGGGNFGGSPQQAPVNTSGPVSAQSTDVDDGDAEWKPVVHAVRGANPPVPATPMPGQATPAGLPTTPGFNQDEPWRNAGSVPGNSQSAFGRSQSQNFGQSMSMSGSGQPGDQADEPPLPALPAHLFEGLPPRPQPGATGPASFNQGTSGVQQNQVAPWSNPSSAAALPQMQSAAPSSSSVDDGWKIADVPIKKGNQALPPLPVPNYQTSSGVSYDSVGSPQSAAHSFTSGSIRVDAIAREIAHSPVALPPAVPGFEPYSVDGGKSDSVSGGRTSPFSPQPGGGSHASHSSQASFASPATKNPGASPFDEDDDFEDEEDDRNRLPWPSARPQTQSEPRYEPEPELEITQPDPELVPMSDDEQNAFITDEPASHSSRLEPSADQPGLDDPEIAALFEGEPVNSTPIGDETAKSPSRGADPAYMQWLEPEADVLESGQFEQIVAEIPAPTPKPTADSWGSPPGFAGQPTHNIYSQPPISPAAAASEPDPTIPPTIPSVRHEVGASADFPAPAMPLTSSGGNARASIEEGFRLAQEAARAASTGEVDAVAAVDPANALTQNSEAAPQVASATAPMVPFENVSTTDATWEMTPVELASVEIAVVEAAVAETVQVPAPAPAPALQVEALFQTAPAAFGVPEPQAVNSSSVVSNTAATFASPPPVVPGSDSALSINADITKLISDLDVELETISNRGSEAFARRDLKGAERMIKLAEKLSEFKESLIKMQQEHGSDLS